MFYVVTRWTHKGESLSFDRGHERDAKTPREARKLEREHNESAELAEHRADGWTWRIVRCVVQEDAPALTQAIFDALSSAD